MLCNESIDWKYIRGLTRGVIGCLNSCSTSTSSNSCHIGLCTKSSWSQHPRKNWTSIWRIQSDRWSECLLRNIVPIPLTHLYIYSMPFKLCQLFFAMEPNFNLDFNHCKYSLWRMLLNYFSSNENCDSLPRTIMSRNLQSTNVTLTRPTLRNWPPRSKRFIDAIASVALLWTS